MQEIKYKYFAWSYEKNYLDKIMNIIIDRDISCICDDSLGRYSLSVPYDYYQDALEIIREIGDEQKMGSINHYDKFRPLKSYSFVYAYAYDENVLDKKWEDENLRPKNIRRMVEELQKICGCDVKLIVNFDDLSVEILTSKRLCNISRIRDRVYDFLCNNNYARFKEVYVSNPEGKVINPTPGEMKKIEGVYCLFDSSFLACGMYRPLEDTLVSGGKEEKSFLKAHIGFNDDIKNIEDYKEGKIIISGETKLYEYKRYNHEGEEISYHQRKISSFETKLVDRLDYNLTIIISDNMAAKIITNYKDSREATFPSRKLFGKNFSIGKSSRDSLLPFPKKSGEYEGNIEEYYMRSTDGLKLLHYATHSPYFEIYDIPTDFDFVNNNSALNKASAVYDIRDFNPEDPKLASVKDFIDEAVQKLELTNKSNQSTKNS